MRDSQKLRKHCISAVYATPSSGATFGLMFAFFLSVVQAGYNERLPLTDAEWSVLPVLVAGRLVQSTLFGLDTISRVRGGGLV